MSTDEHVDESDLLVGALRGDLGRSELAGLTAHLRSCERCREALVELVPVHASLTAASRLLAGAPRATGPQAQPSPEPAVLPPMARPHRASGTRMRLVAAAAAVVVVVGGVVGVGIATRHGGSGDQPGPGPASRSVALAPVTGDASGRVTMVEQGRPSVPTSGVTAMSITTTGLAAAGPGRFYYAWLFDPATNKMLPLGVVSPDGATQFQVSDDLVARYHAVDISLQDDNGDPAHSATSVLRARY